VNCGCSNIPIILVIPKNIPTYLLESLKIIGIFLGIPQNIRDVSGDPQNNGDIEQPQKYI